MDNGCENMILLISICREKMHELEFVRAIESLIEGAVVRHYKKLNKADLENAEKVIICGTSLQDNDFLKDLDKFQWIKNLNKPLLGICGGFQIISLVFGGEKMENRELGFISENFDNFLGVRGKRNTYHLHNNAVSLPKGFSQHTDSPTPHAIKHDKKPIYATLFHPEVRNIEMLLNFVNSV